MIQLNVMYLNKKGFEKYIDITEIKTEYNCWKVIMARASYKHKSGFGNMFIGRPNELHCKTYISFNVSSENEALSLLSYFNCKLPNFILSLRKIRKTFRINVNGFHYHH
jgi:hypothetical protein